MKEVMATGKTVEEAIEKAVKDLGVKRSNVEVEIINGPKQGFFGIIGAKEANVRVKVKYELDEFIVKFINDVIKLIGLDGVAEVRKKDNECVFLYIEGDNMGVLIGKHGQTLNALQYIANVVIHRQFLGKNVRVILDVGDYRQRREKVLRQLAQNLAKKVIKTKKNVVLEPMPPQERRIIHLTLSKNSGVNTYSQGEEPNRKVVIAPNK